MATQITGVKAPTKVTAGTKATQQAANPYMPPAEFFLPGVQAQYQRDYGNMMPPAMVAAGMFSPLGAASGQSGYVPAYQQQNAQQTMSNLQGLGQLAGLLTLGKGGKSTLAGDALGLVGGAMQGGIPGYAQAISSGVNLLDRAGLSNSALGNIGVGAGGIAGAYNLFEGLKNGDPASIIGGSQQAVKAAQQLGSKLGMSAGTSNALGTVGKGLGVVGAGLSVYNAIDGWQTGDTKGNAIRGAQAGAAIGSIVPGLGTLVGGALGGALGAVGSAFGHKKSDSERDWNAWKDTDPSAAGRDYSMEQFEGSFKGAWETNKDTLKPLQKALGFEGKYESTREAYKGWLVSTIADATKSGAIKQGMTTDQINSQVVYPALNKLMKANGGQSIESWKNGDLRNIFSDLTDRVMTGEQVDIHDTNYRGWAKDYATDIPSLSEALAGNYNYFGPSTSASPVSSPSVRIPTPVKKSGPTVLARGRLI